jgi:poly(A) polymerase
MEFHLIFMGKEEVIELYPMLDSEVPIMKFKLNGISIDLVYARLLLWAILD